MPGVEQKLCRGVGAARHAGGARCLCGQYGRVGRRGWRPTTGHTLVLPGDATLEGYLAA